MSQQLDLSKPLSQEQVDELLEKWPRERVQYWLEQSSGKQFEEESVPTESERERQERLAKEAEERQKLEAEAEERNTQAAQRESQPRKR